MRSATYVRCVVLALAASGCSLDPSGLAARADETDGSVDAGVDAADVGDDAAPDAEPSADAPAPDTNVPTSTLCASRASLLACFPFDGSVTDEAPNAPQPTTAKVAGFVAGHEGQAAVIDAASSIVIPSGNAWNVSIFSIEMWIKPTSIPGAGARAGLLDSDGRFGLFLYDNGLRCIISGGIVQGPIVPAGTWSHVACTHSGTSLRVFVNGTAVAEAVASGVGLSSGPTTIGSNSPSGDTFDGAIDSVRVWATARTDAEIAEAAR
jgi:hypothetical protein